MPPVAESCTQVTVGEVDPTVSRQITSTPYAGTNSFVSFERGADGLGPVDVVVNAYIESQP